MTGHFGWFFMSSITQKNDFFSQFLSWSLKSGQIKEIKATCYVKQPLISTIGAF